jgi:hypothetical protein
MVAAYSSKVSAVHQMPLVVGRRCGAGEMEQVLGAHGSSKYAHTQVYFATQHARYYLLFATLGCNCVNGMSMMISRAALASHGNLNQFFHIVFPSSMQLSCAHVQEAWRRFRRTLLKTST